MGLRQLRDGLIDFEPNFLKNPGASPPIDKRDGTTKHTFAGSLEQSEVRPDKEPIRNDMFDAKGRQFELNASTNGKTPDHYEITESWARAVWGRCGWRRMRTPLVLLIAISPARPPHARQRRGHCPRCCSHPPGARRVVRRRSHQPDPWPCGSCA